MNLVIRAHNRAYKLFWLYWPSAPPSTWHPADASILLPAGYLSRLAPTDLA